MSICLPLYRDLTPFEHLVLGMLCEGKTNGALVRDTGHSEKVIENTVSRAARVFDLHSSSDLNVRVMLALACRSHFGDGAIDRIDARCLSDVVGPHGEHLCHRYM